MGEYFKFIRSLCGITTVIITGNKERGRDSKRESNNDTLKPILVFALLQQDEETQLRDCHLTTTNLRSGYGYTRTNLRYILPVHSVNEIISSNKKPVGSLTITRG